MMMAELDHTVIDLDNVNPISDWFILEEAPLLHIEELENLEDQAAKDMGEVSYLFFTI